MFEAEALPDEQVTDLELKNALELDDVSFTWDAPPPEPEGGEGKGKKKSKATKRKSAIPPTVATVSSPVAGSSSASSSSEVDKIENVFKIQKTSLKIPRGQVVAIVGPVGSGKSSFLQGLIGEMRKETGSVRFGGSVSYCPQNAWIQVSVLSLYSIFKFTKWIPERYHS